MKPFPIEELVDRCGSRFAVVVAAAKRAKQIKEGAPPLVNLPTRNPLTIALHEIAAGLVEITDAPEI
ncbi:MAG: DNA-directed RNA polymerase subunit omega, partial [Armatimonadota bacterium]